MNPYKDIEESSFTSAPHLTYEDIATKLLRDHYFLTALELHTELVENGKELPQLREFFSNPGNFEQHVTRTAEFGSMQRSPSMATLDSLDTARYSEDGGGDRAGSGGDVAVLEFELRKAKETINALRANLTQFADGETTALDKNVKGGSQRSLKPHEKRALNFLINEYLLLQDYKLTSITFSDENPDQEFEDWDDVGLNMPRPPNLITLFWGNASLNVPKVDSSTDTEWYGMDMDCQTDFDGITNCPSCQHSLENETHWNHELLIQTEEIELLKQKIVALETEKLNFQKLYDAAIVSLNSLTSPTTDGKALDLQMPDEKILDTRPLTLTATENHYGSSGQSTHSATPEQFEIIDSDKNTAVARKVSSPTSSLGRARESSARAGSVTTLDTLSMNDAAEWARLHYDYTVVDGCDSVMWIDSPLPTTLKETILSWCNDVIATNELVSNDLLSELVNSDKPITLPRLLTLVADTLPRIIPATLVASRGILIPLLASCASLLPASDTRRARLLHSLLALVKRPDPQVTAHICEASALIVKWGGGGELLSTIAELLNSKSAERRLLASQICVYIAPYVTVELCTSLLFSVVMLMCESSESEIRILGLKAACLICPVAESKYSQLENIMFNLIKDTNERVVKDVVNNYLPILARSALIAGKLTTDLCKRILCNVTKSCSSEEWKTLLLYIELLKSLVLAKLAYVANVQIVREFTTNNEMDVNLDEIPLKSEKKSFVDIQCYVVDSVDANILVVGLNCVLKNDSEVRWPELIWFIEEVKQILQMATSTKVLNHPAIYENLITLFSLYVNNFGDNFTSSILKPIFMDLISDLERKMEKLHSVNVDSMIVVGIYLVTVLPVHENRENAEFLQKWIMYSSIRGLPVKTFSIPLKWLSTSNSDTLTFYLQHLREFAASSCETSNSASIRVYIASLLNEVLNVSEVNEECITKILLPAVTAFLHDEDVSVREASYTLWGSLTRYCTLRKLTDIEPLCWAPLEPLLSSVHMTAAVNVTLTGKEGARAAEAAALLLMPSVDGQVNDKAVSLLSAVVGRSGRSAECVSALLPALQLAARHCDRHALLPALRTLEESVQAPALAQFKPAIEALLHSISGSPDSAHPRDQVPKSTTNLQTAQEVGRRVTQMFQQSKTNMNLQGIFKKKT